MRERLGRRQGKLRERIQAVHDLKTPAKTLRRYSWSPNPALAAGVASHPNTPASSLMRIARWHSSPLVIERIPHNPNATPRIIRYLVKKHSALHPACLLAIVKRADCPSEILLQVCERKLKGAHPASEWLATSPQTSESMLRLLYGYWEEPSVQRGIAGNPRTPRDILAEMALESSDSSVLGAVSKNPGLGDAERVAAALRCRE